MGVIILLMVNNNGKHLLTSESVTEGHPDKIADQISDAILDEVLKQDPCGRVAIETLLTGNLVIIAGELTTKAKLDVSAIARKVIKNIGYDRPELGFDYKTCQIQTAIQQQSPDIALGVGQYHKEGAEKVGAGDQGMMYGYACNDTQTLMPLPIALAHGLVLKLAQVRKKRTIPYLRPDGKAQVTIEYSSDGKAKVHTVLVSTQHDPNVNQKKIRNDIIQKVIRKVIPSSLLSADARILVNPTGRFVIGGPVGDTGLTGRKIIVDTYGGVGRHGGGCFSGKDATKVDRSGTYAARWVAKNIVAAKIADKAEVQISYAIGIPEPISINIETFGTGKVPDWKILQAVTKTFDLRPGILIKTLDLRKPIYLKTAAYGHFGRLDLKLPWEKVDKAKELKKLLD